MRPGIKPPSPMLPCEQTQGICRKQGGAHPAWQDEHAAQQAIACGGTNEGGLELQGGRQAMQGGVLSAESALLLLLPTQHPPPLMRSKHSPYSSPPTPPPLPTPPLPA